MTVEEMRQRKKELGYSYEQLSELSGVPVGTVSKILNGYTKAPRYATLTALERVLSPRTQGLASSPYSEIATAGTRETRLWENRELSRVPSVHEPAGIYSTAAVRTDRDNIHTRDELDALPEGERKELIDGVLYDMAAPSLRHQRLLTELLYQFSVSIRTHPDCGRCEVLAAPCDVVIDNDDYTVVQPDLMVLCHRQAAHPDAVYGAPDLVLEILSPSTKIKDQFIKLNKYRSSGVKEYWIVDPDKQTVTVYLLSVMRGEEEAQTGEISIYGFEDEIPVWISRGICSIHMEPIDRRLKELEAADRYSS